MILLAFLLAAQPAASPFPAPDCSLVPGFSQQGEPRSYDSETLFDYMDGNSEGYFAYGFTLMKGVSCTNAAGDQLVFDVSELGDPVRAWGFFVTNRDARAPREAIGSGGQVLPRKATFAKGRYYVEIAAGPDKDHRASLRAFVDAMLPRVRRARRSCRLRSRFSRRTASTRRRCGSCRRVCSGCACSSRASSPSTPPGAR